MSADESFVPKNEEVPYTNDDDAKVEDERTAKSDETGTVSKDEVEGLKDSLGGGQVLEDEGYTRSSNKTEGYAAAEDKLDAQVDATE